MSRRLVGFIITAAGAALTFIATAADLIGISSGGSADMFGKRQIIGTTIGAAMIIAGLGVALLPRRQITERPTGRASEPAATSTAGGVVQVESPAGPQGGPRATVRTVVLLTLVVTALLGGWAVAMWVRTPVPRGCRPSRPCESPLPPEVIVFAVLAGVCLVGGLWCAWRVRTGHWGRARAGKGTVMAERRGHPEAGWVIGLVASVGTLVLAVLSWAMFTFGVVGGCIAPGPCRPPSHPYVWGGVVWAVLAGGCFVGGLWWAWRVGTGHWGRGRRAGDEAGAGEGAGMGERWGHPVAAVFTQLFALVVTVTVFFSVPGIFQGGVSSLHCGHPLVGGCPPLWWSEWGQSALAAAVCLIFGLWVSWRVATGSGGRPPTEPRPPA